MPTRPKASMGEQKRKFLQEYNVKMQKFQAGVKTSKNKPSNSISITQNDMQNPSPTKNTNIAKQGATVTGAPIT